MLRISSHNVSPDFLKPVLPTHARPYFVAVAGGWKATGRTRQARLSLCHPVAWCFAHGAIGLDALQQILCGLFDELHAARVGEGPQVGLDEYGVVG